MKQITISTINTITKLSPTNLMLRNNVEIAYFNNFKNI